MLYHLGNSLVDTSLQIHRIGTGGNILQTLVDDSLSKDGGSSGTITSIVASLGSHALNELGTGVLELVLELHLLGHGNTVLGNLGSTKLLLDNYIATLRTESYLYCIGQLVNTLLEQVTGICIELDIFSHDSISFLIVINENGKY